MNKISNLCLATFFSCGKQTSRNHPPVITINRFYKSSPHGKKSIFWAFPLIAIRQSGCIRAATFLPLFSPRMCGIQMAAGSGTHPQADWRWRTDPGRTGIWDPMKLWFKIMNGWLKIDPDISRCVYMSYIHMSIYEQGKSWFDIGFWTTHVCLMYADKQLRWKSCGKVRMSKKAALFSQMGVSEIGDTPKTVKISYCS